MIEVLTSVGTMASLLFVLSLVIATAQRWLTVVEDPCIDQVEEMLPHTNCSGCGYPGCRAFAEALVAGLTLPSQCSVSSPSVHVRIANYLGVDVGSFEKRVARLACAGADNVAAHRALCWHADLCCGRLGGRRWQELLLGMSGIGRLPTGLHV